MTLMARLTKQAETDASAKFVLTAREIIAARIARTGCRFACAEKPQPSPYCPTHHTPERRTA